MLAPLGGEISAYTHDERDFAILLLRIVIECRFNHSIIPGTVNWILNMEKLYHQIKF
jgi:hypothetical protein